MSNVIKENSICIVYNLAYERAKRDESYKHLSMVTLLEVMTDFLEANPPPVRGKAVLKQGIDIFTEVYKKANTIELRTVANNYIEMYNKEYVKV